MINWVSNFKSRLWEELQLLKKHIISIIISLVVLLYITSTIGRNLAYYRNIQSGRLQDFGFQILPELSPNLKIISEIIMYIMTTIGVGSIAVPLFYKKKSTYNNSLRTFDLESGQYLENEIKENTSGEEESVYTVNIGLRVLNVITLGHILRTIMYLSTTLPAPAAHCLTTSTTYDPPTTIWQILFRFPAGVSSNCGDQVFSGHVLQDFILILNLFRYADKIYPRKMSFFLRYFMVILGIAQVFLIISARNHYTLDVVVALYVAPTLWLMYNWKYPKDTVPI